MTNHKTRVFRVCFDFGQTSQIDLEVRHASAGIKPSKSVIRACIFQAKSIKYIRTIKPVVTSSDHRR